jgi:hypothetical protein
MRLIIEAKLINRMSGPARQGDGVLVIVERLHGRLAELGLSLAEGRTLLAKA